MGRRGNCDDNAFAENFFQLLERGRIRRQTHLTRDAARQDVFDYIEMVYNQNVGKPVVCKEPIKVAPIFSSRVLGWDQ